MTTYMQNTEGSNSKWIKYKPVYSCPISEEMIKQMMENIEKRNKEGIITLSPMFSEVLESSIDYKSTNRQGRRAIEQAMARKARKDWKEAEKLVWAEISRLSREISALKEQGDSADPKELEKLKKQLEESIKNGNIGTNTIPKFFLFKIREIADEMLESRELREKYFVDPDSDFTRKRKITLEDLLMFLLTMAGSNLNAEVYDQFKYRDLQPSTAAVVAARGKLKAAGVEYLFKRITEICREVSLFIDDERPKVLKQFSDLLAFDGTDVNVFTDPNADTYVKGRKKEDKDGKGGKDGKDGKDGKGYNQDHLNGMYSICTKLFLDTVVQPKQNLNETKAAVEMINRMKVWELTLVTADRGYGSLNLIETIRRKPWLECVIRVKEGWIKETRDLPLCELDRDMSIRVITTQTNEDKKRIARGEAKYLSGASKKGKKKTSQVWDFESEVEVKFRVVRFQLDSGHWETLVTTLSREDFTLEDLKEIYHLRWGIESAFRTLKWSNHLAQMHCKLENSVKQEMFARLAMHNIASCILSFASTFEKLTAESPSQSDPYDEELGDKLVPNRHFATHVICDYFKNPDEISFDIFTEINRYKLPVRSGRKYKRNKRAIGFASFLNR